jgi:protoheme IX farnesyltransferase
MSQTSVASLKRAAATAGDLLELTKPRLSGLVLATTGGGMWLAARTHGADLSVARGLLTLFSIAATVGAANALNCYLERDVDRLMDRTRNRPLPAGRMEPWVARGFGLSLAAVAVPALALGANLLTAALAALALGTYVLIYTPLKAKTGLAMWVGAVPGALPPLMGWTSVTNRVDLPGLVLFGILYAWQLPHFLAIAMYRRDEYAAAGIKAPPLQFGDSATRIQMVAYIAALIPISLALCPLRVAGAGYGVTAAVLGAGFLGLAAYGLLRRLGRTWARQVFLSSLVYLTGLFLVLMVDGPR